MLLIREGYIVCSPIVSCVARREGDKGVSHPAGLTLAPRPGWGVGGRGGGRWLGRGGCWRRTSCRSCPTLLPWHSWPALALVKCSSQNILWQVLKWHFWTHQKLDHCQKGEVRPISILRWQWIFCYKFGKLWKSWKWQKSGRFWHFWKSDFETKRWLGWHGSRILVP